MKKSLFFLVMVIVLAVSLAIGTSAKTISLFAFDSTENAWSDSAVDVMAGKVGNAVSHTIDAVNYTPNIVCCHWNDNPMDFTSYLSNSEASLHMWIYVSDVDEIGTDVAIELNDTAGTGKAIRFPLDPATLKNGWNEYSCKFTDARPDDGCNVTSISSMRIFIYGYSFTLAVDDMAIILPGEEEGGEGQGDVTPPTADYISVAVVCAVVAGAALVFTKKKVK